MAWLHHCHSCRHRLSFSRNPHHAILSSVVLPTSKHRDLWPGLGYLDNNLLLCLHTLLDKPSKMAQDSYRMKLAQTKSSRHSGFLDAFLACKGYIRYVLELFFNRCSYSHSNRFWSNVLHNAVLALD